MIDDRTQHLNLPLPSADNYIHDDVARLRDALVSIDAAINSKAAMADIQSALANINNLLSSSDPNLDSVLEIVAAIKANSDAIKRVEANVMLGLY